MSIKEININDVNETQTGISSGRCFHALQVEPGRYPTTAHLTDDLKAMSVRNILNTRYSANKLIISGDVEPNPGPSKKIWLCQKCENHITKKQYSMKCSNCILYTHQTCTSMSINELSNFKNWRCIKCEFHQELIIKPKSRNTNSCNKESFTKT